MKSTMHGTWMPCLAMALSGLLAFAPQALAEEGDPPAGARKSMFCAYCHGVDGNLTDARTPRLAGQNARILIAKMKRSAPYEGYNHPMLQAFITGGCLKEQDIADLAAFYASQPVRELPRAVVPTQPCKE